MALRGLCSWAESSPSSSHLHRRRTAAPCRSPAQRSARQASAASQTPGHHAEGHHRRQGRGRPPSQRAGRPQAQAGHRAAAQLHRARRPGSGETPPPPPSRSGALDYGARPARAQPWGCPRCGPVSSVICGQPLVPACPTGRQLTQPEGTLALPPDDVLTKTGDQREAEPVGAGAV